MAFLSAISGANYGRRFDIKKPETVLGRHPDCDVTIEVGAVSRQHARIHQTAKGFELEDLKSRNGTFLNGRPISERTELGDGDLIRICDVEYSFHLSETLGLQTPSASDNSSRIVELIDDPGDDDSSRHISSKLDIRGSQYGSHLTSSSQARLHAVLQISQNLGRAVKLDEVLPKVLDTLFKMFLQADRAFVVLQEGDELVPRWVKTRKEEQEESFRISRTVLRQVMRDKEAIISKDASLDSRFDQAMSISNFSIRSMIVAPLLDSEGNAIGAMQLDTLNSQRTFEKDDLELLAGVATQAGIAIENAQLHEQLVSQQRVEQDLQLARNVQKAFLPFRSPDLPGYSFFHFYRPAEQIGGDYFDYIRLPDDRLAVVTADVSGHGIAAAMLMAKMSAETRFMLASYSDPAEAITRLNKRMHELDVGMFATFFCMIIDPSTSNVDIVNAGHMLPLWQTKPGHIEEPGDETVGVPLGVIEDFCYESTRIELKPHQRLVMFTDGIHEAPSPNGELYGLNRMRDGIAKSSGALSEVGNSMVADVEKFSGATVQADDMCLVIVSRDS
ncbi:MAG: SpoIIE family protein phosphatase [Aureliella sp.]